MRALDPPSSANCGVYACPETHLPLVATGDELISTDTGRRFPLRAGIPIFLRYEEHVDRQERETLARLNELADAQGWLAGIKAVYGDDGGVTRYVTDERRRLYVGLLPLAPHKRVLEIGPYLGEHTPELASRALAVDALEVVHGRALLVHKRCKQLGFENVYVACGGDDCRLPYAGGSFDVVVMNLVWEWCGGRDPWATPLDAQERYLREVSRVLKPGGVLFLATKNRFALRLLLGRPDEHARDIRFGNALPRWVMRAWLALRALGPAEGLLHSYWGIRRMLAVTGFTEREAYWAIPDPRYPVAYVRTDPISIREALRSGVLPRANSAGASLLGMLPARLIKYFTTGHVLLVQKRDPSLAPRPPEESNRGTG